MIVDYLYGFIVYPLEMFIETVFTLSMKIIPSAGYAIIFVSLAVQLLVLPIYKRADEMQDEERERQREMSPVVEHFKKTFRGDEKVMVLSTYYRQNGYHQYYQLRAILPLLLQIPFFVAAYHFLSNCKALNGAAFYFLRDMGKPDAMMSIGGICINVMPILMTLINIASGVIYTRGLEIKDKLQLYITAGVFLVLLYNSPSGLVFYWTLNNVFSLAKNVFMKGIRNPRPIICTLSILLAGVYCYKGVQYGALGTAAGKLVLPIVLIIGVAPTISVIIDKRSPDRNIDTTKANRIDNAIFQTSAFAMALIMGVLIPCATMLSSPAEFAVKGHYVNPLLFVLYSFVVACGLFVLWGNIFCSFSAGLLKRTIYMAIMLCTVCSVLNYQFFRQGFGTMSQYMVYNRSFEYTSREIVINLLAIAAIISAAVLLYSYRKTIMIMLLGIVLATVIVVSAVDIVKIQKVLDETPNLKNDAYYQNNDSSLTLDKDGKNVIVMMLDRAFGPYIPYIFNEKPELKEAYSGFTYYPNTISHGPRTQLGAPALYGGYEYMAFEMRDITGQDYWDKVNESYKVVPKLFVDEGYRCSLWDPPLYLDKMETPVEYEEFAREIDPSIETNHADNEIASPETLKQEFDYLEHVAHNNYIRHSLFISSPLILRGLLYDDGMYLRQEKTDDRFFFLGCIEELNNMPRYTKVSNEGINTITLLCNSTPHSMDVELQMPDYVFEDNADNSEYVTEWRRTLETTPGNKGIEMNSEDQIQSYEVNMASIMSVARYLEFLKENGLYENTRIIIVSDHGWYQDAFKYLWRDEWDDLGPFCPLLMVKDFGDGEFNVSNEFMTNADVPYLATRDLIRNPINPYTGNPISMDYKSEKQYVYDDSAEQWLTVHDDLYDLNNWGTADIEFANKELIWNVVRNKN